MSDHRTLMEKALKDVLVPNLRRKGFKGTFPHLRRQLSERIEFVMIQFYSAGGSFVVEIGKTGPCGIEDGPWKHLPPSKITVAHLGRGPIDLRLMSSVPDVRDIRIEGRNLVVVTTVSELLSFRIFDRDGKKVVETDETKLPEQAQQIEELRKQLQGLSLPQLTRREKDLIISAVIAIVGYTEPIESRSRLKAGPGRSSDDSWFDFGPRSYDEQAPPEEFAHYLAIAERLLPLFDAQAEPWWASA